MAGGWLCLYGNGCDSFIDSNCRLLYRLFSTFSAKTMAISSLAEEGIVTFISFSQKKLKKTSRNFQINVDFIIDNDYHYRIKIIPRLQYSVDRMNFSYFSPEVC